ncbi:MAG: DNA replication/repair protein RecF [Kangiellaceae bacterium]|nr:DNA replication/repair protein RecF [Kangiellaceae bacterium]
MQIHNLSISHLRNIQPCKLDFSDQLNIIYGDNAAGKTSILEALYILGNGRSFRTAKHAKVIEHQQDAFTLFAQFQSLESQHKLGLKRQRNGDITIKLNQESVKKLSDLATTFPVQVLAPEQYELLSKGPSARRKLLDWGVFHVEHSFLNLWQRSLKILLHRNQLLKTAKSYRDIEIWDKQLIPLSEAITEKRQRYVEQLSPIYQNIIEQFITDVDTRLHLYPGWAAQKSLTDLLPEQFDKDRRVGFTQSSIQKADLKIYSGSQLAVEYLSRGQQKMVITALKLAQLKLMQQQGQQYPIFLLDDIGAELDQHHQQKLLKFLANQPEKQQIFITCVHLDPLKSLIKRYNKASLFHVEHGRVQQIEEPTQPN